MENNEIIIDAKKGDMMEDNEIIIDDFIRPLRELAEMAEKHE